MSKNSCCKDCTDRHPLCHSTCDRYKLLKKEIEELKAAKEKQRAKTQKINKPYDSKYQRRYSEGGH